MCTPYTLPLDPPLSHFILLIQLTWLYFQTVHQLLFFLCCCLDSVAWLNQTEPSSLYQLFLGVCHQFELEHFGKKISEMTSNEVTTTTGICNLKNNFKSRISHLLVKVCMNSLFRNCSFSSFSSLSNWPLRFASFLYFFLMRTFSEES